MAEIRLGNNTDKKPGNNFKRNLLIFTGTTALALFLLSTQIKDKLGRNNFSMEPVIGHVEDIGDKTELAPEFTSPLGKYFAEQNPGFTLSSGFLYLEGYELGKFFVEQGESFGFTRENLIENIYKQNITEDFLNSHHKFRELNTYADAVESQPSPVESLPEYTEFLNSLMFVPPEIVPHDGEILELDELYEYLSERRTQGDARILVLNALFVEYMEDLARNGDPEDEELYAYVAGINTFYEQVLAYTWMFQEGLADLSAQYEEAKRYNTNSVITFSGNPEASETGINIDNGIKMLQIILLQLDMINNGPQITSSELRELVLGGSTLVDIVLSNISPLPPDFKFILGPSQN